MPVFSNIDQSATKVQDCLDDYLHNATARAKAIDPDYERLWLNIQSLSSAGGKRLRPRMSLMSYHAFGGSETEAMIPIAAAQELLHLSLLIHDDIIDRDDTRYGVANITGRYRSIYSPAVDDSAELQHYSQSAALLAGDVVLSSAYQIIISSQASDQMKLKAIRLLGGGIFEVCGGELLDTEAAFKPFTETNALTIARYKTASYSFIAPLLTGASLAGASQQQLELLRSYAENLGIAYQLTDDLIGSFGDESITGKSSLGDIREGKHTYLIEQHLLQISESEQASFWQVFGNPEASLNDIDNLKQAMIDSGAKSQTENYIDSLALKSRQALGQLDLSAEAVANFESLIQKATKRKF